MSDQIKSNPLPQQPSCEREPKHSPRQFIPGAVILIVLAGTVVYTLGCSREQEAGPTEEVGESSTKPVASAPSEPTDVSSVAVASEPYHGLELSEFVGSEACAECHFEIAETYAEHPMAKTLASVADASPIEIVEGDVAEFEAQGCRYRVERVGDRMIHTEFMTDDAGQLIYEQSVDVRFAAGSGMNARTYLIDRGGLMFESPITWYTEKQKWDLSPGYHDNPRQRFNRRITDDCVQCHSGRAVPVGLGTSNRFAEPPFQELGIGCENCHGPGKKHIELYTEADSDSDDDDLLIVNPSHLDRRLEDSVCYQCHMEGHRRILRKGKSFHDFRPGMAAEDIWTVFVSSTPFESDGTAQFTSHVQQMESSACFLGSDGAMRCTTCHDPHEVPKPQERAAFYRERCNSCHSDHGCSVPIEEREKPPALNSCIHCHMPMIGSSDIPHTSLSDHRVLRNPGNDLELDESQDHGVWTIFGGSETRMPEWEVQRARALALCDQAMYKTDRRLVGEAVQALEAALEHDPNDVEILRRLGFVYGATRDYAKAASSFQAAVRVDPYDEMSLKNLGLMALRTRSVGIGLRSYQSYLEVNQWDGTMYGPYAALLASSGDIQGALQAVERGLQLDPTQRELRGLAAQLYERTGNRQKSLQQRQLLQEISKRLDPWDQKRRERNRREMQESIQRGP